MDTEIIIVRGDKNFRLSFQIYDADGNIVDLSNVSQIVLKYKEYTSTSSASSITGTVSVPGEGKCYFDVGTQFVGVTGEYKAEIEITFLNGKVLTVPNLVIKVIPDL